MLFEELGLTKKRRGKTGFSTDARVLAQIRDEHEIIAKVESWRELTKLKNTYLDALPDLDRPARRAASTPPSTRWRRPPGGSRAPTRTCRTSRSAPRSGARSAACFVAERGHAAAVGRLQPGRAAGTRARRRRGRAARDLRLGRGRPRETAAEVLAIPPDEVGPAERSKAKMVNYGIAYGLSAFGLADRLQISREEAAMYIERYFERFPAVKALHRRDDRQGGARRVRLHAAGPPAGDPRAQLGDRPAAAEQRVDEPVALRLGDRLVDEALDGREALEVALDVERSLLA